MLLQYLPIALLLAVGVAIGVVAILIGRFVGPHRPDPDKLAAYECGFEAFEDARMKFDVRYYLVAILFIIFDLEIAFFFPWALVLDEILPKDRNLIFDSGNNLMAAGYISVPGPAQFKLTTDFASIGMGFGTAMGFAVGAPERQTVFVLGDGSFLMTMGELETVAREGIPMVIVLMNDCAYGAELHFLKERDAAVDLSVFPDIDYEQVAEAFGFETATVRTLDELRALAPMLEEPDGPVFIECKINASVVAPYLLENVAAAKK